MNPKEKLIYEEQMGKRSGQEITINENYSRLVISEFKDLKLGNPYINRNFMPTKNLFHLLNKKIYTQLNGDNTQLLHLLPMNCRLEKSIQPDHLIYVIESHPELRTISLTNHQHNFIEILKASGHWDE